LTEHITLGPVHHVALRVAQLDRSIAFYQSLLGFQVVAALPDMTLLSNGALILGLCDQAQGGRFDEFHVGLDHMSFAVTSREDLDRAAQVLDQRDIPHGEIEDLGQNLGLYVLAFRDPDNIQLELTATYR
jgi:glyoxylase I family protein